MIPRRWNWGWVGVAIGILTSLALAGQAWAQPAAQGSYFYRGSSVPVRVLLDRIGVLARSGVTDSVFRAYVDSLGLKVRDSYPDGIHIVTLRDTLTRNQIDARARLFADSGPGIVADAGFVVTRATSITPNIVTQRFIARFRPTMSAAAIDSLNGANRVTILDTLSSGDKQYVLEVLPRATADAMDMANRYVASGRVLFAHPDFIQVVESRSDPLLVNQWHLDNLGLGGGSVDADIDATKAWPLATGAGTVVAVIDGGIELTHEDLAANIWTNPAEVADNHKSDDANDYEDDVHGWNFHECDSGTEKDCQNYRNADPSPAYVLGPSGTKVFYWADDHHATPVAGLIAARKDNDLGGVGVCPECKLMVLRRGVYASSHVLAFNYARENGADVISCSWGFAEGSLDYDALELALSEAAREGRLRPDGTKRGCVIVFAMNDDAVDDCDSTPDISSHPEVIAVSASTDRDQKNTMTAFGECMDVLAPSNCGAQWITTTDISGDQGYNTAYATELKSNCTPPECPTTVPALPTAGLEPLHYYTCFMGTSAAAPMVAGAAGLVLSANPDLSAPQVRWLLEDTADKIENSTAAYDPAFGFSRGTTDTPNATHGFGRINAYEAVRVVAAASAGGRGGIDAYFRDNDLDWGNTEQPSNSTFENPRGFLAHFRSPDIKVDAPDGTGAFQATPMSTAEFDAFQDENAKQGVKNRIVVRVRNRGPKAASPVDVALHYTHYGTSLPLLPPDFWTATPWDAYDQTDWHPIGKQTLVDPLAYSGSAAIRGWVAKGDPSSDGTQFVAFDFDAPVVGAGTPNHYCLIAVVDAPNDRPMPVTNSSASRSVDALTPIDNNITQRNIKLAEDAEASETKGTMFAANPTQKSMVTMLTVEAPKHWKFDVDGSTATGEKVRIDKAVTFEAGERVLITLTASRGTRDEGGDVTILQHEVTDAGSRIMGGATLRFPPRSKKGKR